MELPSSELELNCLYRNWNWSRIAFIGIGIGIELPFGLGTGFGIGVGLPLSELELELNCKNGIDPSSEMYVNVCVRHCCRRGRLCRVAMPPRSDLHRQGGGL